MAKGNKKQANSKKPAATPHAGKAEAATDKGGTPKIRFEYEDVIEKINGRSADQLTNGWLAHVPELGTIGLNPASAMEVREELLKPCFPEATQERPAVVQISGIRDAILHEGIYLLHKATHVEMLCARNMQHGRYTWAVSDAYQASLFALSAFLAINGIVFVRDNNDHIIVDAWPPASQPPAALPQAGKASPKRPLKSWQEEREAEFLTEEETASAIRLTEELSPPDPSQPNSHACQLIRFKKLDHFHKWGVLKRVVRSIQGDRTTALRTLRDVLNGRDDKQFSTYRNQLHYQSDGWIYPDLFDDLDSPPFKIAESIQEMYDEMYKGTAAGGIFLMILLIEVCCAALERIFSAGAKQLEEEVAILRRRYSYIGTFISFDPALMRNAE